MNPSPSDRALALWLAQQQQASQLAQQQSATELHLHNHHHAAPVAPITPAAPITPEPQSETRLHPLVVAATLLLLSVSISLPLAMFAAVVEAVRGPEVHYVPRSW